MRKAVTIFLVTLLLLELEEAYGGGPVDLVVGELEHIGSMYDRGPAEVGVYPDSNTTQSVDKQEGSDPRESPSNVYIGGVEPYRVTLNQNIYTDAVRLAPAPQSTSTPAPAAPTQRIDYYPVGNTFTSVGVTSSPAATMPYPTTLDQLKAIAVGTDGVTAKYTVGGVSLTKAAAEQVGINIDIEGLYFHDGQLVLAGTPNGSTTFDAAIFLTALRTACDREVSVF